MRQLGLTNEAVVSAVKSALGRSRGEEVDVYPHTRLDELRVESMEMIEILIAIEETTGCVILDSELAQVETVGALAACKSVATRDLA